MRHGGTVQCSAERAELGNRVEYKMHSKTPGFICPCLLFSLTHPLSNALPTES
jgi:hypothetical protein